MENIFGIFGFLLFWISLVLLASLGENKNGIKTIIYFMLIIISFIIVINNFEKIVEKKIAEKFLKGQKPYRMEIKYEMTDSIVTSIDTVYVEN